MRARDRKASSDQRSAHTNHATRTTVKYIQRVLLRSLLCTCVFLRRPSEYKLTRPQHVLRLWSYSAALLAAPGLL